MERISLPKRDNWQARCEEDGFSIHSIDGLYWNEGYAFRFSETEIDALENATAELHAMCLEMVSEVVRRGDYQGYGLGEEVIALAEASWLEHQPSLYGRFDLAYDGKTIKLLEYNADTPTGLLEASVIQWRWLTDLGLPDQFNSIHEKLIEGWGRFRTGQASRLHLAASACAGAEDWDTLHYLLDTALQAGFDQASSLNIEEIGEREGWLVDSKGEPIQTLFKLYPFEWLANECCEVLAKTPSRLVEPAWKLLLSTKAILPMLWSRHPGHPLLLEAYFANQAGAALSGEWAKKPLLSREGANITRLSDGRSQSLSGSHHLDLYDQSGYVLQRWMNLPVFDGLHACIGSWVVNDLPAGIGIREERSLVTGNGALFIPHFFE
ncbi:glutathionylspermidine synthase family protein [Chromobacterium sp. ASV23]|uniref:glutathionylspermidine synthase family protein n=1 Tax=Chromobacterium sp. ASV23 TaxID=2795110 RepID=UPI0018EC6850|nr:glutathionylspermidine synthase family protein [Chromobacterium sp. ASV23]